MTTRKPGLRFAALFVLPAICSIPEQTPATDTKSSSPARLLFLTLLFLSPLSLLLRALVLYSVTIRSRSPIEGPSLSNRAFSIASYVFQERLL